MAEEIRLRLVVDGKDSTATIAALEKSVAQLKKQIEQTRATGPVIPPQPSTFNSLDALKKQLSDLKKQLSAAEIGSDGFKSISAQVRDVESQLRRASDAAKGIAPAVTPAAGSMAELRTRVRDAMAELQNVPVGSKRFKELESSIFQANSQLKNLRNDLKGVTDEKLIGSFVAIGKGITSSFAAASSAASLFATNTQGAEEITKAAAKAQEYLALVVGLANVQLAIEETREARLTIIQRGRAAVTSVLAAAQAGLNAVMSANPIALVVLAVGSLVAGMIALKDRLKFVSDAFAFMGRIASALTSPLKAVAESLGLIGESDATRSKNRIESLGKEKAELEKRYSREVELAQAAGRDVAGIEQDKLEATIRAVKAQIAEYDRLRTIQGELNKDQLKEFEDLQSELIDLQVTAAAKRIAEERKSADALAGARRDLEDTNVTNMQEGFQKELAEMQVQQARRKQEIQKQLDEIDVLKRTSGVDQNTLDRETVLRNQLLALNTETEKRKAELSREFGERESRARLQLAVTTAEDGSAAQINAQIKLYEFERELARKNTQETQAERELKMREYDEKIAESRRQLADREAQENLDKQTQEIEARLSAVEQGSVEEFALRRELAERQSEFEVQRLRNSAEERRSLAGNNSAEVKRIDDELTRALELNAAALSKKRKELDEEQRQSFKKLADNRREADATSARSSLDAQAAALRRRLQEVASGSKEEQELIRRLSQVEKEQEEQARNERLALLDGENAEKKRIIEESYEDRRLLLVSSKEFEEANEGEKNQMLVRLANERNVQLADADKLYNDQRVTATEEAAGKIVAIEQNTQNKVRTVKMQGLRNAQLIINATADALSALRDTELEGAGENEEKKKKIRKKYAEFEFQVSVAKIVTSTAEAIAKAPAELGPILGAIYVGLLTAQGLAQVAIASAQKQKVMALAKGGLVTGPGGPEEDRVPAMLSPGESVINARSTRMFYPILSAINEAGGGRAFDAVPRYRLADGGVAIPNGTQQASDEVIQLRAAVAELAEMVRAEASKPVVVVEADITQTQRKVRVIENRSKIA